jgi:uncharacterized membrane protein
MKRITAWLASRPLITTATGVLLLALGLVLPRIKHTVPGPFYWDSYQQYTACHNIISMTGTYPGTSGCRNALWIVEGGHVLMLAGLGLIVTGIVLAARRWRERRAAMTGETTNA